MTSFDQFLLNILYDPRVGPGMTKEEVNGLLPKVLPTVRAWVTNLPRHADVGRLPIQQNIVHPDFHRDFHVRVRQNIEAPVLHRVDRDPCDVGGG
jgi:hypothetical protein